MPLTKEVVSFPFAAGLDEKSSDKTTPPGKLVTADNVRIEKTGQMIKREAYVRQSRTGKAHSSLISSDMTSGTSAIPHKDGMLLLADEYAYKRTSTANSTTPGDLVAFANHTPCHLTHEFVRSDRRWKTGNAHHVRNNGYDVYTYVRYALDTDETEYHTMLEVYDSETGESLYADTIDTVVVTQVTNSIPHGLYFHPQPQLLALGDYVFIFLVDDARAGGTPTLKYCSIRTSTGVASSIIPTSLASMGVSIYASHPIYSVDKAKNYFTTNTLSQSSGCVLLAYVGSSDVIKLQYFTVSSGTLTGSGVTGATLSYDVVNTSGVDKDLFFSEVETSSLGAAIADENPVVAGLSLSCLNDINGADSDLVNVVCYTASTASGGGGSAVPQASFFGAKLSTSPETINLGTGKSDYVMVAAGAASQSDGGSVHIYSELSLESTAIDASTSSAADRYSDHVVVLSKHTRGGSTNYYDIGINCSLTSHPFRHGTATYAVLTHYACNQFVQGDGASSNMFLVDSNYYRLHAAGSMGTAPVAFAAEHHARIAPIYRRVVYGVQRVQGVTTGKYMFGCSKFVGFSEYIHDTNGFQNEASFGIASCTVDFNLDRPVQHVEAGKVTLMTGGCLMSYDGERIVENGFITAPKIVESRVVSSGGAVINAAHKYCAIWEWVDAQGNVHRSSPSNIETVEPSSGTTNIVEIEVLELPITNKRTDYLTQAFKNDARCVLYRTMPTGSVFYRYAEAECVKTGKTIQFEDKGNFYSTSDVLLEDNEQLYTTAELSNGFIGSCTDIAKHKSRIFARTTENIVNCSKPLFEGDAPAFVTDQLAYNIILDGESNPITCIESNLEHLLIFTDENGYILAGDGPDAFGTGGFLKPRKFAPGIGVLANSPHTVTRDGAFLVTTRGIYLVKANLSIEYIGAAVEDIMASHAGIVLSIDVLDGTNEVLIALNNNLSGSSDTILRYNYAYKQWTRDLVGYASTNSQVDACVLSGNYYRLTSDGYLHKQTPGGSTFQDSSTGSNVSYNMVLKTGFIPRAGLQKSQRMYRWMLLGDYLSDFTLTVKTFTDYSGSADTTFTKSVTSSFDNPMQFRGHIDKQKSQAIAVEITAAGAGACATLDSLALEVGRRPSKTSIKLPATETL